jgi:asparagine synthase (glutamine-hydrolysing)
MLTLAAYPGIDVQWDVEALYWYLALHYVPGDCTMIRGVRKLPPGHLITVNWDSGRHRVERYWRLQESGDRASDCDEIGAKLESAVRSRLIADVPVGIFLSGGLDSSLLAAFAVRNSPNIATFSMGFAEASYDERPFAEIVARALGTDHHHFEFDENSFHELLPRVVEAMDEPIGDPALLPVYWLSEAAVRHVKVVLSGEGADELLAGYGYYSKPGNRGLRALLSRRRRSDCQLLQQDNVSLSGFPLLTTEQERLDWLGLTEPPESGEWYSDLVEGWQSTRDPLRRRCLVDIETWLSEDLLMKLDKAAMAHGLEGRAPYLSPALAETTFALPRIQKLNGNRNKVILRDLAERMLPPAIAHRSKQGFVLPMRRWLVSAFANDTINSLVADANLSIDPTPLNRLLQRETQHGIERERLSYALLVLAKWASYAQMRIRDLRKAVTTITRAAA